MARRETHTRIRFEPDAIATASEIADRHGVSNAAGRVDVRSASDVESALGGCDILCANVGVQQFGAIDRLTNDDWLFVLDVNGRGSNRIVLAFLPSIRARDGYRRVLLTASLSVLAPAVRMMADQTCRLAVMSFGGTLRHALVDAGIGGSLLFPGDMLTGHLERSAEARPPGLRATGAREGDVAASTRIDPPSRTTWSPRNGRSGISSSTSKPTSPAPSRTAGSATTTSSGTAG